MIDKINNSEIKLITYFGDETKNQVKKESKGFIIYDKLCNATFIVTTCHGLFWDKGDLQKISIIYKKTARNYSIKNFIFNKKLDLAIKIINWKNLDYERIITTDDFDLNLNNDKSLFNYNNKIFKCTELSLQYRLNDNICILYKYCKYNFRKEYELEGYSGVLSFTRNKLDSVFLATEEDKLVFIPGFYVKYMIENFSKSKSNFEIYNLPINVRLSNDNKSLTTIEDYDSLESGSVICKIDDKNINGGYIYDDNLKIPVLPDVYIMLNCGNKCKVSIKKERSLEEMFLDCKLVP